MSDRLDSGGKCGMVAHFALISFAIKTEQPADNVDLELHCVSTLAMVDEASKTWGNVLYVSIIAGRR
jgi:hypothetical protein